MRSYRVTSSVRANVLIQMTRFVIQKCKNSVLVDSIALPEMANSVHPLSTLKRSKYTLFLTCEFYVFGLVVATESYSNSPVSRASV